MEKAQVIVDYLKATYEPEAVILHGSRAIGKERQHSDWDILMLFKSEPIRKSNREDIEGEDVEWKAFTLPVEQSRVLDDFGVVLQNARVLWERNGEGNNLLELAQSEYAKGAQLTKEDHIRYRQFLTHKLHSLEDDRDTPYMFLRHLGEFFNRASNWWFEVLHDELRKPLYIALPEIQERDPEYFELLMILCGENSKQNKIDAARGVIARLFP